MLRLWAQLQERLLGLFRRYGRVAFVIWFGSLIGSLVGFYVLVRVGVDLAGLAEGLGMDSTRLVEAGGAAAAAWAATFLTKPLRIVLALAVTPPVAHWWERRRAAP